jgi:hypothetical protein
MKANQWDTIRYVLITCGGVPFVVFIFIGKDWAHAALLGYLLTACLFGLLLAGEWPAVGTSSFWKAIIPITVAHSAIICGLVYVDLNVPEINRMPRMLYGFATIIFAIEGWSSLRIIALVQPPRQ